MKFLKNYVIILLVAIIGNPLYATSPNVDGRGKGRRYQNYYGYYSFVQKDIFFTVNTGTSAFDKEFYFEAGISRIINNNEASLSLKTLNENILSYDNLYLLSSSLVLEYSVKLFKTTHCLTYFNIGTGYGRLFPLSGGSNYKKLDSEGFVPVKLSVRNMIPLSDRILLNIELGCVYSKTSFLQSIKPLILAGVIIN